MESSGNADFENFRWRFQRLQPKRIYIYNGRDRHDPQNDQTRSSNWAYTRAHADRQLQKKGLAQSTSIMIHSLQCYPPPASHLASRFVGMFHDECCRQALPSVCRYCSPRRAHLVCNIVDPRVLNDIHSGLNSISEESDRGCKDLISTDVRWFMRKWKINYLEQPIEAEPHSAQLICTGISKARQ